MDTRRLDTKKNTLKHTFGRPSAVLHRYGPHNVCKNENKDILVDCSRGEGEEGVYWVVVFAGGRTHKTQKKERGRMRDGLTMPKALLTLMVRGVAVVDDDAEGVGGAADDDVARVGAVVGDLVEQRAVDGREQVGALVAHARVEHHVERGDVLAERGDRVGKDRRLAAAPGREHQALVGHSAPAAVLHHALQTAVSVAAQNPQDQRAQKALKHVALVGRPLAHPAPEVAADGLHPRQTLEHHELHPAQAGLHGRQQRQRLALPEQAVGRRGRVVRDQRPLRKQACVISPRHRCSPQKRGFIVTQGMRGVLFVKGGKSSCLSWCVGKRLGGLCGQTSALPVLAASAAPPVGSRVAPSTETSRSASVSCRS